MFGTLKMQWNVEGCVGIYLPPSNSTDTLTYFTFSCFTSKSSLNNLLNSKWGNNLISAATQLL